MKRIYKKRIIFFTQKILNFLFFLFINVFYIIYYFFMENKNFEDDKNGLNIDSIKFAKYYYCIILYNIIFSK